MPGVSAPIDRYRDAARAAAARWPGLTFDAAALRASLLACQIDPTDADLAARGAELVLAHAAAAGDRQALALLERELLPRARGTMHRYVRDEARTDELVQQLRVHMLLADGGPPRIARYDGRAPLGAWLCMCAARLALHALRDERRRHEVPVEWNDALAQLTADDDAVEPLRAKWADAVAAALRTSCESLSRRHRAVIRLLFVEGSGVDDVAAVYQVHRVTVWRWVQEAQQALRDGVRAQLGAALAADQIGASTLVAWVEGQVLLSLDQVLTPTATDIRR